MVGGLAWLVVGVAAAAAEPDPAVLIRHTLSAHESVDDVVERYAVSLDELRAWNDLRRRAEPGTVLSIHPRSKPVPRQYRRVKVREGDDWERVAERYDVDPEALRAWNPHHAARRRLAEGAVLVAWSPSGVQAYPLPPITAPLPEVPTPAGGCSIGTPNRGRLQDGVRLPDREEYTVRIPHQAYGSALTVRSVQQAILEFRRATGFARELTIGAMSRRTGRRLRPHVSHQSGRDVDVRLPAMPFAESVGKLDANEVDWFATWALIDAFVRTGEVRVIFLERKFFGRLRKAAMRLGADDARIEHVMDHVRHSKGHVSHVHVRFRCAATDVNCHD